MTRPNTFKKSREASGFMPMTDFEYSSLIALVDAYGAKRICENARAIERDRINDKQED